MAALPNLLKRKWSFFVVIAIGFLVLVTVVKNKKPLPVTDVSEKATLVETLSLSERMMGAQIIAFGHVKPQKMWQAISEVEGRVTYKNPSLERGKFIDKDTVLLTLDPLHYELQLAQAKADLDSVTSELERLDIEANNLKLSLEIERNQLTIVEKEVTRKKSLLSRKLTSQSSYDQERRNLLVQRQKVQDLENQLTLVPSRKLVLEASEKVQQARVSDAERLLEKTVVRMPFTGLIVEENINEDELISPKQVMVVAHDWSEMEVEAQVGVHDMRRAMRTVPSEIQVSLQTANPAHLFPQAEVVMYTAGEQISWPGQLTRISGEVDQSRGTVGLIVEVEQDLQHMEIRKRPPLVAGMFVEVRVTGNEQPFLAVPAKAVHDGQIYVRDKDSRLRIRPVRELFTNSGWVAITSVSGEHSIKAGDEVILTDLIPVIEGALLKTSQEG
ncbi:efflux RND transporter periplasmic adaptor subunit [Litoribrevibacter euphylliae]|uniref:Efflux RND transporter periplasmic adaptor subunit n=1 Tax=Litoribrevibacter euphylliae TaxID=1834034 RepID=A0ABV7HEF3_9GAMM